MLTIDKIAKTGIYTKREVCDFIGCTPRTLNRKMNSGHIKYYRKRDTGKPMFKGVDVMMYLTSRM